MKIKRLSVIRDRAFTLIELLVVIAIIAILAAILFPVFAQAKSVAKQTACISQIKQLSLGLALYANDESDYLPTLLPRVSPLNGGTNWNIPYDMMIMPYIKNADIFHCPSDSASYPAWLTRPHYWDGSYFDKKLKRSYGIVGNINTLEGGDRDVNTGAGIHSGYDPYPGNQQIASRSVTGMDDSAGTIVLLENWFDNSGYDDSWIGEPYGSIAMECDIREIPGRQFPAVGAADTIPGCTLTGAPAKRGHTSGTIYGFADGHAKLMSYYKIRSNDFWLFKSAKPAVTYNP